MERSPASTIDRNSGPDRCTEHRQRCSNPDRSLDRDLVELVDAIVAAVDLDRSWEIERVAAALEPFGAASLFNDELRLNGTASPECPCRVEGWL